MSFFGRLYEKFREFTDRRGYVCDGCGGEVFEYPEERLCSACEEKLRALRAERVCPKCGRKTQAEGVCLNCKEHPPKFDRGFSPFVYKNEVAGYINRIKNDEPRLALYFGERMAEYFLARRGESALPDRDGKLLVLGVPLAKEDLRERGYNQAQELVRALLHRLKEEGVSAETDADVLQKRRKTASQKKMSVRARRQNVKGAYHIHKRKVCRDRVILLVDDIMTTGATGDACASLLVGAGAKAVYFLTAAALPEQN